MKLRIYAAACAALCVFGCSTAEHNSSVTVATHVPISTTGSSVHAVCSGLTAVNPAAYAGWAGECPGCDVDAKSMAALCQAAGAQTTLLLNEQATKGNVERAIKNASEGLRRGDLLIITHSGHGGQVTDTDGDEADGMDETICLWDGQLVDDHVLEILAALPAGLRVLLVTDTCHSEGNFRGFVRKATRTLTLGRYGHRVPRLVSHRLKAHAEFTGQLIQMAACREDSFSYGEAAGGEFTCALRAAYAGAATTRAWFDTAKRAMPERQQPQWVEFGSVEDDFRFSVPLK